MVGSSEGMAGQDGWILAKFFICVFVDRGGVEAHKLAKNERGQCPAILTKQAWSVQYGIYPIAWRGGRGGGGGGGGWWLNFYCGTQWIVPSRQDSSTLPAQVANQSAGFGFSCLLTALAYL